MPITQSKLKNGSLTFAVGAEEPAEFNTQATNVRITPGYDEEGDAVTVLSGDSLTPDTVRTNELTIGAIQDFTDPAGFVAYMWANDLAEAAFVWETDTAANDGVRFTGLVQLRAPEVGGDVNARLTTELTLIVNGPVTGPTPVTV
ncbi:hypothetical protein [Jannaschia sp. R86511]|uniref:hypothetical protein n=1 Tax=Jannaschia sp. R86511 TaxID=3093853 RepID=UPI0036D33D17